MPAALLQTCLTPAALAQTHRTPAALAQTDARWLVKSLLVLVVLAALLAPAWLIARRGGYRRRALLQAGAFFGAATFVVLAAAVALEAHIPGDYAASIFFQDAHRHGQFDLVESLSALGSVYVVVPVTVLLAVLVGLWSVRSATYLLATVLTSTAVNLVIKGLFQRPPPRTIAADSIALSAFPSGHAMRTMTLALALALILPLRPWRWPVAALGVAVAVLIGISRVYLGAHYFSDVIGAWALSLAIACLMMLLWERLFPRRRSPARTVSRTGTAAPASGALPEADAAALRRLREDPSAPLSGVRVVLFDWGNTLMVDHGFAGPMTEWPEVDAVPGAAQVLERLSDEYTIGVATNADASGAALVEAALRRVGLASFVERVFSSRDIGAVKPDPAFYAAVLRELRAMTPEDAGRLQADEVVMVGDSYTNDVAGAKAAGLLTVWFNQDGRQTLGEAASDHDAVITRLDELPAVLAALGR